MYREPNHVIQRQPKSQTDRAKSTEGRTAALGEEVAQGPFVDPGAPAELAAGSPAQNLRPLYGPDVQ
jgi:hypothetical protein